MRIASTDARPETSAEEVCARAFEQEFSFLYWMLRRQGVRASEAEDLTQEVFLVLWRRRQDLLPDRPLRPWLAGVAFHLASKHLARRRREGGTVDRDFTDDSPGPHDRLATARERALVREALARLPERHRRALLMHEIEETPMRAMADLWGVPLFTAYTRLRAARKAFAAEVERLACGDSRGVHPVAIAAWLAVERDRPAPAPARERVRRRLCALWGIPLTRPTDEGWSTTLAAVGMTVAIGLFLGMTAISQRSAGASTDDGADENRAKAPVNSPTGAATATTFARVPPPPVFLVDPATPAVSAETLADGLTGQWSFEPGARLKDGSGNQHDCVERRPYDRPVSAEGADGTGAAAFARSGWLECPQPDLPAATPLEMTVAARLRSTDLPRSHRAVVSRAMEGGQGELFYLGFGGSRLILRSTPWRAKIVHPFPEAAGRWVHLAFTHQQDGITRLYVDGREVGHANGPTGGAGAVNTPLIVGIGVKRRASDNRPLGQFKGDVDDVLVYDRALSADEIAALSRGLQPGGNVH